MAQQQAISASAITSMDGVRSPPTIKIPQYAANHSSGPPSSKFPSSLPTAIASSAGPLLSYPHQPTALKSATFEQKSIPAVREDGTDGSEDLGPAAEHSEVIVELNNVHKTYLLGVEGVPALRGVSVHIHRGEWVVVYGTSGGGKTSLLNIIGTIDTPTKGDMKICGVNISPQTKDWELASLRLNKLGFVFQTFNLLTSMTARENVELPMTLSAHHTPSVRRAAATASLHRVGLGHRLNHFPNQLSGGEQQRVTIARAIANEPELLLLDEPTGDLDTISTNKIVELLHRLNVDHAMTLVMVTHDVHLKNFAHRVIYMRDGKLAKQEIVTPLQRQKAVTELYERIKTDKRLRGSYAGLERIVGRNGGRNQGDGEGGPVKGTSWKKTEIRDPRGYATFSEKALPASFIPRTPIHPSQQPSQVQAADESAKGKGLENSSACETVK